MKFNTNSNTYIIIYSIVMVVIVAVLLSVAALGLKKVGQSKVFADSATLQGQLKVVAHLVKVENA